MPKFMSSSLIGAACLSAAVVGLSANGLFAQSAAAPRAVSAVHIPGTATTFDWLAKKNVAPGKKLSDPVLLSSDSESGLSAQVYFGHGSYICSPAGFAHKSRCFTR